MIWATTCFEVARRERTFFGGDGNDRLYGGYGGYDQLVPGSGDDSLNGGPGLGDRAVYQEAQDPVIVSLQDGTAAGTGTGTDSLTGLENIIGSQSNDTLTGDAGPNYISDGNNGADTIHGLDGDDVVFSGDGNDTIDGGLGNDSLRGNGGDDSLDGGDGDDALWGGNGTDTCTNGETNRGCEGQQ